MRTIAEDIRKFGVHLTFVNQSICPRFGYSIGLHQLGRPEYIIAGAIYYDLEQIKSIMNSAIELGSAESPNFYILGLGEFSLRPVDDSWIELMMLGALDFYDGENPNALQIVPEEQKCTIDVPNMSVPWSSHREPVWKWLRESWPYSVPPASTATTNLAALRGIAVTEAARWELDEWELFAGSGPDTPNDEIRVVPLATLVASDPTLEPVISLVPGQALWRESAESQWHSW